MSAYHAKGDKMRILRFTAEWCAPCKTLERQIEKANLQVPIEIYNIDDNTDLAAEYGIRSVPTLILMDGNTEVKRKSGILMSKELEEWVASK